MSKNAAISIALAAFNGSEYIAQQLQSLLEQTRQPDEIVISDDSPDEKTFEAVKPFLSDPRIVYCKNTGTHGVTGNFENAITRCSGEYIFLCDQDDVWYSGKVERLAGVLDSTPKLDGVFCNSFLTDANLELQGGNLFELRKFTRRRQQQFSRGEALKVCLKSVPLSGHNIAFKRRNLDKLLPFPELTPFYPDTWIALSIAASGSWQTVNEALTLYRVHASNQSAPGMASLTAARKARSSQAAMRNALLAGEILRRNTGELSGQAQKQLLQFQKHHQIRSNYKRNYPLRFLQILREFASGRYLLYSNGIKTALADFLLG